MCFLKKIIAGEINKQILRRRPGPSPRSATEKVTCSTPVTATGLHHIFLARLPSMISSASPSMQLVLEKDNS